MNYDAWQDIGKMHLIKQKLLDGMKATGYRDGLPLRVRGKTNRRLRRIRLSGLAFRSYALLTYVSSHEVPLPRHLHRRPDQLPADGLTNLHRSASRPTDKMSSCRCHSQ